MAPGCVAPSRPHAAAPRLRRRLPVGRHPGQEPRSWSRPPPPWTTTTTTAGPAAAPAAEAQDQAGVAAPAGATAEAADSALHATHGQARPPTGRVAPDRHRRRRLPDRATRPWWSRLDNVGDARPQVGLNEADVVFEEMVEGGSPASPPSSIPAPAEPVGPIRSARSTDIALVGPLNVPLFAYSGANAVFKGYVRERAADRCRCRAPAREVLPGQQRRPPHQRPQPVLPHLEALRPGLPRRPGAARRSSSTGRPASGRRARGIKPVGRGSRASVVQRRARPGPSSASTGTRARQGWTRIQNGSLHTDARAARSPRPT